MAHRHIRASILAGLWLAIALPCFALTPYRTEDADTWSRSELSDFTGDTLLLQDDWYITDNYNFSYGLYSLSPRRIFAPTNQAEPGTDYYYAMLRHNAQGSVSLWGENDYHRCGERLHNARVRVQEDGSLLLIDGIWHSNSRADILQGYDTTVLDARGQHTLLVCAANLEYYLVKNVGQGMGPASEDEHMLQREKVSAALARIQADIYGLVEVERGAYALAEIAQDLTEKTGRAYAYIGDNVSVYGTYTKSGYVYCTETVRPGIGPRLNNQGVQYRKYMQCFEEIASGESFILSINHFKAKSGSGNGSNSDQDDGQGSYNADRVAEAQSVLEEYNYFSTFTSEPDLLVMGDLNAYGKEEPIRRLTDGGLTDLHRLFHANSSYTYRYYDGTVGYLDHALANRPMLEQVTGMLSYHINSDEHDCFTYDSRCNDGTMFRYSDHDPVLVGLRLRPELARRTEVDTQHRIHNAQGGYLRIYSTEGWLEAEAPVTSDLFDIPVNGLRCGVHLLHLYYNGTVLYRKILVP